MTSVLQNGGTRHTWFKKRKKDDNRKTVGRELEYLELDHAVKTDQAENSKRRTLTVSKQQAHSWGFTVQSYGIHYTKQSEVEMLTYVDYVDFGGPAYIAGMQAGDVILSINGVSMETADHTYLIDYIRHQGNSMRLVVLFEDCVRKVELHLRLRKLKNLLAAKEFELKSLELREKRINDGFGSLSDSRWSLRSTSSSPHYSLPHDSRSLNASMDVCPLTPASPYQSPDLRNSRALLRQHALDRHDSRLSFDDVGHNNPTMNTSVDMSMYGDDDSPHVVLNPRVDLKYTSLPSNFRRKDNCKSHVGKSTFYSATPEDQSECLDTDSVFDNELSRDLSIYETWTGDPPYLDRDSGVYNTWSVDRKKKRRGETRSIGNSLFYVESEESLNKNLDDEPSDKSARKREQFGSRQTELDMLSQTKPPDLSYEQMGARPKSKYSTCSDSQLSVRHKKDKDAFGIKYRHRNDVSEFNLTSLEPQFSRNTPLVSSEGARSRRPSSLPIITPEEELTSTPDVTPLKVWDSGIESPVFLENNLSVYLPPMLTKSPAEKLSQTNCDINTESSNETDYSRSNAKTNVKSDALKENSRSRQKHKQHALNDSPKSSPLLNMKKMFTRSPSLPSLYSKSKWSPFEFTRNKLRNSLSKLRRKSGSYTLSDSKVTLPSDSSNSKPGRSAIGQLIRSASTISMAQVAPNSDTSGIKMYGTLPKKSRFFSLGRRSKSTGNVLQNEQTQLKFAEVIHNSSSSEQTEEPIFDSDIDNSPSIDQMSVENFDFDVVSNEECISSEVSCCERNEMSITSASNIKSAQPQNNDIISEFEKLTEFDFQLSDQGDTNANDTRFLCERIAECSESVDVIEDHVHITNSLDTSHGIAENCTDNISSISFCTDSNNAMDTDLNVETVSVEHLSVSSNGGATDLRKVDNSDGMVARAIIEQTDCVAEDTEIRCDMDSNYMVTVDGDIPVAMEETSIAKETSIISGEVSINANEINSINSQQTTTCDSSSVSETTPSITTDFEHSVRYSNLSGTSTPEVVQFSNSNISDVESVAHSDVNVNSTFRVRVIENESDDAVILPGENETVDSDITCDTHSADMEPRPSNLTITNSSAVNTNENTVSESVSVDKITDQVDRKRTVPCEEATVETRKIIQPQTPPIVVHGENTVLEPRQRSKTACEPLAHERDDVPDVTSINSAATKRYHVDSYYRRGVSLDRKCETDRSRGRTKTVDIPVIPHKDTDKLVIQPKQNRSSRLRSKHISSTSADSFENERDSNTKTNLTSRERSNRIRSTSESNSKVLAKLNENSKLEVSKADKGVIGSKRHVIRQSSVTSNNSVQVANVASRDTNTNTNVKGDSKVKLGSDSKVKLGSDSKVKLGSDSKVKLESDSKVKLGSDSKVKLGSDSKVKLESDSKVKLGTDSKVKLGSDSKVKLGSGSNVKIGSGLKVNLVSGSKVNLGSGSKVNLGSGSKINLGSESKVTLASDSKVNREMKLTNDSKRKFVDGLKVKLTASTHLEVVHGSNSNSKHRPLRDVSNRERRETPDNHSQISRYRVSSKEKFNNETVVSNNPKTEFKSMCPHEPLKQSPPLRVASTVKSLGSSAYTSLNKYTKSETESRTSNTPKGQITDIKEVKISAKTTESTKTQMDKTINTNSGVGQNDFVSKTSSPLSIPAKLSATYGAKIRSRSKSPMAVRNRCVDGSDVIPGIDVQHPVSAYSYKPRASSVTSTAVEHMAVNNNVTSTAVEHMAVKNSVTSTAVEHMAVKNSVTSAAVEHMAVKNSVTSTAVEHMAVKNNVTSAAVEHMAVKNNVTSTVVENKAEKNGTAIHHRRINEHVALNDPAKMHDIIKNSIILAAHSKSRSLSENSNHSDASNSSRSRASTLSSDNSSRCYGNQRASSQRQDFSRSSNSKSNSNNTNANANDTLSNQELDVSVTSAYETSPGLTEKRGHYKMFPSYSNSSCNTSEKSNPHKIKKDSEKTEKLKFTDKNIPIYTDVLQSKNNKPENRLGSRIKLSNVIQMCMDRDGVSNGGTSASVTRKFNPTATTNISQRKPIIASTNEKLNKARYMNYINKQSCETQL